MPSHSSLIFLSYIILHNILELNSSNPVSLIFGIDFKYECNAVTFRNVTSLLIFCGNLLAIYFKTFPIGLRCIL